MTYKPPLWRSVPGTAAYIALVLGLLGAAIAYRLGPGQRWQTPLVLVGLLRTFGIVFFGVYSLLSSLPWWVLPSAISLGLAARTPHGRSMAFRKSRRLKLLGRLSLLSSSSSGFTSCFCTSSHGRGLARGFRNRRRGGREDPRTNDETRRPLR
jgi:hypothetical protein